MLRELALKHLPQGAIEFVQDCKIRWRDRRTLEAFEAVDKGKPLVLYCIGARGGVDGLTRFLRAAGKVRIVGFEPEPAEAARLARNGAFDYTAACGLGNATQRRVLHLTRNRGCSSVLVPHAENLARYCKVPDWFTVEAQEPIDLMRAEDAAMAHNLPAPDMLEIDTQGFDFEVLEGCGKLLDGVSALAAELHFYPLYRGQKTINEVTDWLAVRGFALAFMRRNGYYGDNLVEVNACFYNQKLVETSARSRAALEFWRARYGRGA